MRAEAIASVTETNLVETQGDLVKHFNTTSIDRKLFQGDKAIAAARIAKPRKNNASTPNFFKLYYKTFDHSSKTGQPAAYLATIEAVGAHFLQLVFSPHFTPKVRVVEDPNFAEKPMVISKEIPGFRSAEFFSPDEITKLVNTKQRDFARLILIVFCFKNPDLHVRNWGVNRNGDIVEFDQDQIFCNFTYHFQGKYAQFNGETEKFFLDRWPDLIYNLNEAFDIISDDDILNMPIFEDTKTYNHPLRRESRPIEEDQWNSFLGQLQKNHQFVQWKFFYLTKYLLLLSHERIETTIKSHSPKSANNDSINQDFLEHIKGRHLQIKDVLFHMPRNEYQFFLDNIFPGLERELEKEITAYNASFSDCHGVVKKHKEHHAVSWDWVKEALKKLKEEANLAIKENTIENQKKRRIRLEIARIFREINVTRTINEALNNPTAKHDVVYLEKRLQKAVGFINQHITLLLKNNGDYFSTEDFTIIWNALPPDFYSGKYILIGKTVEFSSHEKIPEMALEWLALNEKSTIYVDPYHDIKTQRFFALFSVLRTLSSNQAGYQARCRGNNSLQMTRAFSFANDGKEWLQKILALLSAKKDTDFLGADLMQFLNVAKRTLSRCVIFPNLKIEPGMKYVVRLRFENAQFTLSSQMTPVENLAATTEVLSFC